VHGHVLVPMMHAAKAVIGGSVAAGRAICAAVVNVFSSVGHGVCAALGWVHGHVLVPATSALQAGARVFGRGVCWLGTTVWASMRWVVGGAWQFVAYCHGGILVPTWWIVQVSVETVGSAVLKIISAVSHGVGAARDWLHGQVLTPLAAAICAGARVIWRVAFGACSTVHRYVIAPAFRIVGVVIRGAYRAAHLVAQSLATSVRNVALAIRDALSLAAGRLQRACCTIASGAYRVIFCSIRRMGAPVTVIMGYAYGALRSVALASHTHIFAPLVAALTRSAASVISAVRTVSNCLRDAFVATGNAIAKSVGKARASARRTADQVRKGVRSARQQVRDVFTAVSDVARAARKGNRRSDSATSTTADTSGESRHVRRRASHAKQVGNHKLDCDLGMMEDTCAKRHSALI